MVAEAVVRMISTDTRSRSRRNSQAYHFLLDQGGAEDIAGQPDLGRDQMPSPGAPPSRPIHHCPSPTKLHQLSTPWGGRDYRPPFGNRTQIHAASLKEGHDTEARPHRKPRGQALKAQNL